MRVLLKYLQALSVTAVIVSLLACSQEKGPRGVRSDQVATVERPDVQHSFDCPAPPLLQRWVKTIHFNGDRNSEESEPYVGAFSTKAIAFDMRHGAKESIALFEPMYFTSQQLGSHDGCEKFAWRTAGPYVFFDFMGAGGNPYPPQQVMFLDETSLSFKPVDQLHPLLGQDFVEFEKSGCLVALRHGDGLVNRICFQDSAPVLINILLEERYQANAWHAFLCNFSGGQVEIAEYRVKLNTTDVAAELDPTGNREKMLNACSSALMQFNEKAVRRG